MANIDDLDNIFDDPVKSCTTSAKIADGRLIDISEQAKSAGFKLPVAMTRAAWIECVDRSGDDEKRADISESESVRLQEIIVRFALEDMASSNSNAAMLNIIVNRPARSETENMVEQATLQMKCCTHDKQNPVLIIQRHEENKVA